MRRILLLVVVLAVVGCTGDGNGNQSGNGQDEPAQTVAPTDNRQPEAPESGVSSQQRPTLEAQYQQLNQSQQEIEAIWTDLQAGTPVACTRTVVLPIGPEDILARDGVSQHLFQAAVAIQEAVAMWQAECQHQRPQPPNHIINAGLQKVLAAETALGRARDALSP